VVVGHEDIAGVEVLVPVAAVTEVKADFSAMVEGGGPRPQFRLRFDASGAAPTVPSNGYPMPILSTDSTFSMIVPLGEYRVSLTNIPAGFSIKSFTAGSVDLTKEPLKIALPGVPPIVIVFTKPPWMKVIGRVTGIENSPIRATQITMTTTTLASPQTAPVAADGSFEFPTLLPGVYRVQLTPAADPFNRFVTVSADGSPVEIPMAIPAWRVSGRVVVGSNETIPAGMQIQLAPEVFVPGRMSFTTAVNSDGSFFFSAVQPGRYLASISVCRGDVCIGGPPSVGQGIITVDSDRIDLVINR
jgi:hypothetical protein